jgi:hypothetical protein
MKKNILSDEGFTLIEMVLYTSLFSVLMSVAVISGYSLVLGGNEIEKNFIVMQEQGFINHRINLFIDSAQQIISPSQSESGEILEIKLLDGSVCSFNLGNMHTWCGTEESTPLVGMAVGISEAHFTNNPETILSPGYIQASYRLNGRLIELDYYY